jgi:hypothetical protein
VFGSAAGSVQRARVCASSVGQPSWCRTIASCAPPSTTSSGVTSQAGQVNTSTIASVLRSRSRSGDPMLGAPESVRAPRGMVVGMWAVVYRKLNSGDVVTLDKGPSEAAARQDFADRVKNAPAETYTFVRLVCDGVVVEGWPG